MQRHGRTKIVNAAVDLHQLQLRLEFKRFCRKSSMNRPLSQHIYPGNLRLKRNQRIILTTNPKG